MNDWMNEISNKKKKKAKTNYPTWIIIGNAT